MIYIAGIVLVHLCASLQTSQSRSTISVLKVTLVLPVPSLQCLVTEQHYLAQQTVQPLLSDVLINHIIKHLLVSLQNSQVLETDRRTLQN